MPKRTDHPANRDGSLNGVFVAFDLDNTLFDAHGTAYRPVIDEFLSMRDLGLDDDQRFVAYESLRSVGRTFKRLGLANPIHERGHADHLAVLCLLHATNADLLTELGIDTGRRDRWNDLIAQTEKLRQATRTGTPAERLAAEIVIRRFVQTDPDVGRFQRAARRLAADPRMVEWSRAYRVMERRQILMDCRPLLEAVRARGGVPLVISKGRVRIQGDKLERLGLLPSLTGRILITEAAANVAGRSEFARALNRMINAEVGGTPVDDVELSLMWHFSLILDSWSTKSAPFFGRCLHAVQRLPNSPETVLSRPSFVPAAQWEGEPLRFVMIGDRYDLDIAPLLDLLGPSAAYKVHFRQGKYAVRHPELDIPAARQPNRTITNWDELWTFLAYELKRSEVAPITRPPDIVSQDLAHPELIQRGLASEFEAVRVVAQAVAAMIELKSGSTR